MVIDALKAIQESLPPVTDYLTYLTILESYISPEILPTLNDILQDVVLTQNIGWDLIHPLLSLPGAQKCLITIARLGNPKEVVLKVTEALQLLQLDSADDDDDDDDHDHDHDREKDENNSAESTSIDRFCTLVNLLEILHPRIKTRYPSRFLSTSLIAILSTFRPSNQATLAVISFVHTISGAKRPSLPGRNSTISLSTVKNEGLDLSAPDPEAQDEDPEEAAIQTKLLQSFITHILEEYVNRNPLEWSARLQESFDPRRVVTGKRSLGEAFREDPALQIRDTIVGQLVALSRDLGALEYQTLFQSIYGTELQAEKQDIEENHPSSPGDVPLSRAGSLFLVTSQIFSSILFQSNLPQPELTIFPDHAKLTKQFIGVGGPAGIGGEEFGIIDAVLALGLWLESNNRFVSGPLQDEEFLQELQLLSLISANNLSPSLRYAAHRLCSSILHAHPVDRVRLMFIIDTLEHCPYETLKASAVSWLKAEIMTAVERKSENVFASPVALAAAQPYLFTPVTTAELADTGNEELLQEIEQSFSFHMAVINFLFFIASKQYAHVVPPGMLTVADEIYLGSLKPAREKALEILSSKSDDSVCGIMAELQLLGERIKMCSTKIDEI